MYHLALPTLLPLLPLLCASWHSSQLKELVSGKGAHSNDSTWREKEEASRVDETETAAEVEFKDYSWLMLRGSLTARGNLQGVTTFYSISSV